MLKIGDLGAVKAIRLGNKNSDGSRNDNERQSNNDKGGGSINNKGERRNSDNGGSSKKIRPLKILLSAKEKRPALSKCEKTEERN